MIFTFFIESQDNILRMQAKWIYKAPCYAISLNTDLPRCVKYMARGPFATQNPTVNPDTGCPVHCVSKIIQYEIITEWYAVSASKHLPRDFMYMDFIFQHSICFITKCLTCKHYIIWQNFIFGNSVNVSEWIISSKYALNSLHKMQNDEAICTETNRTSFACYSYEGKTLKSLAI